MTSENTTQEQSIHRVVHEIKRRKLKVLRVTQLTPLMRRITLQGPELSGFISRAPTTTSNCSFRARPRSRRRWKP